MSSAGMQAAALLFGCVYALSCFASGRVHAVVLLFCFAESDS